MVDITPVSDPKPDKDIFPEQSLNSKIPRFILNVSREINVEAPRKILEFLEKMSAGHLRFAQINPGTEGYLNNLGIIEVEEAHTPTYSAVPFPYFQSDQHLHQSVFLSGERLSLLAVREKLPEATSALSFIKRARAVDLDFYSNPAAVLCFKQRALDGLHERTRSAVMTPNGRHIRLSHEGHRLAALISSVAASEAELLIATIIKLESFRHSSSPLRLDTVIHSMCVLTDLTHRQRHFRKLYLAVADGSVHTDNELKVFVREAVIDQAIVNYLGGNEIEQVHVGDFLRHVRGGRYCPPPFRRSQEGYERTINESRKIVIRSRNEASNFSQLAFESKRLPDKSDSLLLRFGLEIFQRVTCIHSSDQNIPPGGGFSFEDAQLDKLFFTQSSLANISQFKERNSDWLTPAVDRFDGSTFAFLRGAKIVIHRDSFFTIDRVRYGYVALNDHQNSSYRAAMLVPVKIITDLLAQSHFELDQGPQKETISTSKTGFSAYGLYKIACAASTQDTPFWPIDVSGISCLFAGPAFGLPPGSVPYFTWEKELQYEDSEWHDSAGHVHCSYRIWDFRGDKDKVDETMKPLQKINERVREVVVAYQQLLGLFHNRYAAWKSDLTPGEKTAPRMLTECYRVHQFYADREDAPILVRVSRARDAEPMIPVIDCKNMKLYHAGSTYQMPRRSDGTENAELSLWNHYVRPYLVNNQVVYAAAQETIRRSEGEYELRLIGREYLSE